MNLRPFNRLLIANRGEIALRVMRSAKRLGLTTIAVYSDADAQGAHVRAADDARRLGPAASRESYLAMDAVLAAARVSGAEAIHPGYGFLAENAAFAQAVIDAGLVWVGPPPQAMRAMGDKAEAKRRMNAAGVPCLAGYEGAAQDDASLAREAERIGFPLMIKAVAGGGGRGMRRVESLAEFSAALTRARSEAQSAFADGAVLLERAVDAPRHVEVQVFADAHGHVVHLGERDCSVQRRHQKLIEEAPSPAVDSDLRARIGRIAVEAARAIDYVGAGTIEGLLDAQGNYTFMEMNTRLQVEHPVTEALTGYDLVEWQLRVAMGEALPEIDQQVITERFERGGHSIEVRLCAEDPAQGFLPQSGTMQRFSFAAGELRVETHMHDGAQVSPHYDSMIAKLISHADDRATARKALMAGLLHGVALGVRTNQGALAKMLGAETFAEGRATTAFLAEAGDALLQAPVLAPEIAAIMLHATRAFQAGRDPCSARMQPRFAQPLRLEVDGGLSAVALRAYDDGGYSVGEHCYVLKAFDAHEARLSTPQGVLTLHWAMAEDALWVGVLGHSYRVIDQSYAPRVSSQAAAEHLLRAPMAGRIVQLAAVVGADVKAGDTLAVLEAMKMEHPLRAKRDGRIKLVKVAQGAQVALGTELIELESTQA